MAKLIILALLAVQCLLFLSFAMFNDSPDQQFKVGSMPYMMLVCGIGIALSAGVLCWLFIKDNRPKR